MKAIILTIVGVVLVMIWWPLALMYFIVVISLYLFRDIIHVALLKPKALGDRLARCIQQKSENVSPAEGLNRAFTAQCAKQVCLLTGGSRSAEFFAWGASYSCYVVRPPPPRS